MKSDTTPLLLHFRVSHYNEKVRWALDHKGWPHVREALVPGFHIPRVRWVSGQNQVPVLVVGKQVLAGSSRILAELERMRPDPLLYPTNPAERQRALEIEAYFDDEVGPDLRRLFWGSYIDDRSAAAAMAADGASPRVRRAWHAVFPVLRPILRRKMGIHPDELARTRGRLSAHLDRLEREIGESGYLVGDRFTVADLAAASILGALIRPPQFPYPLPEPWPEALLELRSSMAHRAGFRWTLDMYARHRGASCEIA
jgi:glutathione S-transferase